MKRCWQMMFVLLLGSGLLIGGFPTVYAQEEEKEEEKKEVFTLDEIVVTATKREESILEVPITMSAFDGKRMEALGMTSLSDLEQLTAGLQFGSAATQQRSDGDGIVMRGIGTQMSRELHSDQAVAIYVDGVYTVDSYGLAPNLFDLERVEVARGPQGTLHGRNSIAGSISFVTKRPTDEWDAQILTEFTDQVTQRYNVAFGGPITKHFSFRINGGYFDGDGAQENVGLGDDYDAPHQETFSPKLRFKTDRLDVNISYTYVEDTGSPSQQLRLVEYSRDIPEIGNFYLDDRPIAAVEKCSPVIYEGWGTPWSPQYQAVICDDVQNKVQSNRNGMQEMDTDRYTANVDFDITDTLTLRYTFGAAKTHTLSSMDSDYSTRTGTAADPSIPSDLDAADVAIWEQSGAEFGDSENHHIFDNEESSHELLLMSSFDGPLNFVAGVYIYENETLWQHAGMNYATPYRFSNADDAAAAASPIFGTVEVSNCAEYLDDFFLPTFGDPATRTAFGLFVACPTGSDHTLGSDYFSASTSETVAYFASADYRISDKWFVSAGLRWTEDEKSRIPRVPPAAAQLFPDLPANSVPSMIFVGDFFGTGVPVVFGGTAGQPKPVTWDAVIGNISLEYMFGENRIIYGRIATGYRGGGYNYDMVEVNPTFAEETLVNYEAGVKGMFLMDRLQLTSGVFYQDYEDYQIGASQRKPDYLITPTDGNPLAWYTANVPDSSIWGLEVEATFLATERFLLSGYYTYLDSEIGPHAMVAYWDPDATTAAWPHVIPQLGPEVVCTPEWIADNPDLAGPYGCYYSLPHDNTGNQLPNQPHHKGALTAAYTMPLPSLAGSSRPLGTLQLLTTFSYTGKRWASIVNISRMEIPAYSRWDLRVNWFSDSGRWGVALYVQNVLDEIGVTEFLAHDAIGSLSEPRQIGLQLRWKY